MNKKVLLLISIIALVLIILIAADFYLYNLPLNKNVKFSRECNPYYSSENFTSSHPSPRGILNQTWISEDTLFIEMYGLGSCQTDSEKVLGDYSINGDNLTLTQGYPRTILWKYIVNFNPFGFVSNCFCAYDYKYEISNLEQNNYSISLFQ